jgi:5-formyltetrahydrofolate cyclo-ligase
MAATFNNKEAARQYVWNRLQQDKAARFPFPPHGRIPNFAGARQAAERLLTHPLVARASCIKVNPDAPQREVRRLALEQGIVVYVPTPRLRGGFKRFDPARIPADKLAEAASLSKGDKWAETVALRDLPAVDLIVTGSVAVTAAGKRCGKGHGYSDIEYAIFRELGYSPVPVVTTVHELQWVDDFPVDVHDLPVNLIVTPERAFQVDNPLPAPEGIAWDKLSEADLEAMPILRELQVVSAS